MVVQVTTVQVDHHNPTAFEGDIGVGPADRELINGGLTAASAFKGTLDKKWEGGIIPFVFDRWFDTKRRQLMLNAMRVYHQRTCIRFVPKQAKHQDYIRMVRIPQCWSRVGRTGGEQLLKLGDQCLDLATTLHELMHAVGFYHEQSRMDRDEYVRIYPQNIMQGQFGNFKKYLTNTLNQPYDFNSIMHYRNNEFSKNGFNTIEAKQNTRLVLGNNGFSKQDIVSINLMYNCGGYGNGLTPRLPCKDGHAVCAWSNVQLCRTEQWMVLNCRKTCGLC